MSGKKNKQSNKSSSSSSSSTTTTKKSNTKKGNAKSDDTPPPPQRSSIFGMWTGKTPVTHLHEHCQKSNWENPEFDIKKQGNGYLASVTLRQRNKRTAQMQTVVMTPPPEVQTPTAAEAKHVAATYALHRVRSHLPMHQVLPPTHRDYWRQFEQLKTTANSWQYNPDPFNAHAPTSTAPKRQRQQLPTKEHAAAAVPLPPTTTTTTTNKKQQVVEMDEKMRKYWESLPAIQMASQHRELVERVIKRSKIAYQPLPRKHTKQEKEKLIKELVEMGFRATHADEALDYSADKASALDWLCLHVPEDDLPANFMLANYNPTMTTISHTTQSLSRDWLLKRMSSIGYPEAVCEEALNRAKGDESKALELLQWRLTHGDEPLPELTPQDTEELQQLREDELTALESIYESTIFQKETDSDDRQIYHIQYSASLTPSSPKEPVTLQVIIPKDSQYPYGLPLFVIECDNLPKYLKMALIRGLVEEAERNRGMPFIYMCTEWFSENLQEIISHPPKLRDMTERLSFDYSSMTTKQQHRRHQRRHHRIEALSPNPEVSLKLKEELENLLNSPAYVPMGLVRSRLPAHEFKSTVIKTVLGHQVTIVSGETGCGKTTQVPQFILDEEIMQLRGSSCNIICTQPRKISAIGVAERVAAERCEKVGETVGYAVRGETRMSRQTRLQFVTTGVLLRRLQSDPYLRGISHVMIDEVHERSVDSDFLLIILREVLRKRKDLKIVLMSATINQELFSSYFGGAPTIQIPGFTHPVQDFYLEDILEMMMISVDDNKTTTTKQDEGEWAEWQIPYLERGYGERTVRTLARYRNKDSIDYDLVARTVRHIIDHETVIIPHAQPAILIFMPGAMEIKRCIEVLQDELLSDDLEILPLHANLSPQEQTRVFKTVPAHVRKIVVATNVAETSITIEGVVYVIDSGRVKETQFEASNQMMHLVETWASRASCKQRRGRAGRTRPGQCFKLFTQHTDETKMRAQQVPELLRTPLEQLCLTVKAMGHEDIRAFLAKAIDPPSVKALDAAVRSLRQVDAIDVIGDLTPLGRHMASIPADLRISKMLLFGSVFGCLEPILTIASIMSLKSPFTSPMEKREEAKRAREKFNYGKSDWLADMKAYEEWHETIQTKGLKAARKFCEENFLSFATLNEVQNLRRQYREALSEIGFSKSSNENVDNINLIKSIIFAGLNPNVAKIQLPDTKYDKLIGGTVEREKEAKEIKYITKEDGRVFLHPSSLLFSNNNYNSSFLTYFSKMATSKTFIRDGTEVPSYGILFFGGQINVDHLGRGLTVGEEDWIKFRSWARIGVLVNQLKRLLQLELEYKIEDPDLDVSNTGVAHAIISLITNDGL
ncbi:P-loop containing nucleoside triphosphate hydrolase protein [Cokeromyces recurvatus]|uniref:P-loop containing nucleoside triphosphate hydrolase protein n=1 Tax=Cokeromyces recurvatus TaxID=90255 RepID=UPI00221EBB4E|nr:P-loop containing nucleoside triphosphate hydrolase protein [Cokeromyces recurvatus]KAI7898210.1 P-loop containing nucleoside triphosphate hydrolase protein [Cokeromyces recurvatus]